MTDRGPAPRLAELSARLSRCPDLDTLVGAALDGLAALFGYEYSLLLLLDEDGTRLYTIASHGYTVAGIGSEVRVGEGVIGMANYIIHENTWTLTPACYLQDLFVDPARRAAGVGQQLIDWLVASMATQGWSRLYWHTRENNYRARGLYDKYTPHSGFVRYVIDRPQ